MLRSFGYIIVRLKDTKIHFIVKGYNICEHLELGAQTVGPTQVTYSRISMGINRTVREIHQNTKIKTSGTVI